MNKVKIYGGLGNQMFQYALCTALNQKGKKSRISFSNFLFEDHHNGFSLCNAFKIKLSFPLCLLNNFLLIGDFLHRNRYVAFIGRRIIQWRHKLIYKSFHEKKAFNYDPEVFEQNSSFLVGIWQVESYFNNIKGIIQQEFEFRKPIDKVNIELVQKITSCASVSIHIRKGDYETSRWKNILGIVNNTNYYNNAITHIKMQVKNAHFYIFSDDMEWVMKDFQIANCTYVNHNKGKHSYIDMYLMSLCKHNIIANSTFSWWGAWLNKNESKIVIMPEKWINCDYPPVGIYPKEWIKMKEH